MAEIETGARRLLKTEQAVRVGGFARSLRFDQVFGQVLRLVAAEGGPTHPGSSAYVP